MIEFAMLIAYIGGILINFVRLGERASIPVSHRPEDVLYWLQFFITPAIGSFFVYVYATSGVEISPLVAVNVGASGPLLLKQLASSVPPIGKERIG